MHFFNTLLFSVLISSFGHAYGGPVAVDPSEHPVVQYLMDQGIEVEVFDNGLPSFPEQPTFQEKLKTFWQELDLVKEEIAERADKIKTLTITSYTNASTESKRLSLDVDHNEASLTKYLDYFDKKWELTLKTSLKVVSPIDLHNTEEKYFIKMKSFLDFWATNLNKMNELASIIEEVEFGKSFSNIYLEFGKITLSEKNYQKEFYEAYKQLQRAANVFAFKLTNSNFALELKFDLDKQDQFTQFNILIGTLEKSQKELNTILSSGKMKSLDIRYYNDKNKYYRSSNKLWFASEGQGLQLLPKIVSSVAKEILLLQNMNVKIEMLNEDLTEDYMSSVSKLEKFQKEIKSKLPSIERIMLSYYDKSKFDYKTLYINGTESDSVLAKIIQDIK